MAGVWQSQRIILRRSVKTGYLKGLLKIKALADEDYSNLEDLRLAQNLLLTLGKARI